MRSLVIPLRHSARALWRARIASTFIVATLALCIGASTGVFSIVYAVLVRSLPFRAPDRLVWVASLRPNRPDSPFSLPELMDLRERARTIDLVAYASWSASMPTDGVSQRLQGIRISANAFDVLGAEPSAGRLLRAADDAADADRVVVVSYGFWQRNYGGRANVVNSTLRLNGEPYTVVGVLPRHFPLPLRDLDVVAPLVPDRDPRRHLRSSVNFLRVVGRLRAGVTPEAAERELSAITADLRATFPTAYATKLGVHTTPLQRYLVGDARLTLLVLLGCVGLMLAIAFANVINLLLIRATTRQGEIAVRRALGASAWHVASQLLTEGVLLAVLGAGLGATLGYAGTRLVTRARLVAIPRLDEVGVDAPMLLFVAAVLALATGVFSLAPLGSALRAAPQTALRTAGRSGAGGRRDSRLRAAFVVSQVALGVVLTATTGALLRSLTRLERVELGFRPDSVFVARLALPPQRYASAAAVSTFYDRLHAALASEPGVIASGVVSVAPLSGLLATVPFTVPSGPPVAYRERPTANFRAVSPDYFTSIHARLVAGRAFRESDDASAPPVAVVSRAFANRYFGSSGPVGQQLVIDDNNDGPRPLSVVGVVDNMRHIDLAGPPAEDIYIALRQVHRDGVGLVANNQFWTVRLSTSPTGFGPVFVRALRAVDPEVATGGSSSLSSYVNAATARQRFAVALLVGISVVALGLATVGVYGVMAYSVAQRRREVGVRLALGAAPRQVIGLVLGQAVRVAMIGVGIGIGGSLFAGKAIAGLLFGVVPNDAGTLLAVAALMVSVSGIASWIPARRAARLDPVAVLSS